MKTDAPMPSFSQAWRRVLGMQDKLHRWSKMDATARFDDLYNLVVDPAFLLVAWERVSTQQRLPGAATPLTSQGATVKCE